MMESSDQPGVVRLYGCDGKVLAFNGDEGLKIYVADSPNCKQPGYLKDTDKSAFSLAGVNYTGTLPLGKGNEYLNYDGHPGYDYRPDTYKPFTMSENQPVFAATSGTIFYPLEAVGMVPKSRKPNAPHLNGAYCYFHALAEIPDGASAYRIYYLHLLTHPASTRRGATPQCDTSMGDTQGRRLPFPFKPQPPECVYSDSSGKPFMPTTLPLPAGTHVMSGCEIARTGDAGVPGSPHLHFELQQISPKNQVAVGAQTRLLECFDEVSYNRDPSHICLPLDPYGWAPTTDNCPIPFHCADPYQSLTGVTARKHWVQ